MPTGPKGQKRPADAIGRAVKIAQIATGEAVEDFGDKPKKDEAAVVMGRKGAAARAAKLTPEQRSEIAKNAATKRWSNH